MFAGDFTQLKPVGAKPLFLVKAFSLWWNQVHTFLELEANHWFTNNPEHGLICAKYRSEVGVTEEDVDKINLRIVCKENNLSVDDLPENLVIATRINRDHCTVKKRNL